MPALPDLLNASADTISVSQVIGDIDLGNVQSLATFMADVDLGRNVDSDDFVLARQLPVAQHHNQVVAVHVHKIYGSRIPYRDSSSLWIDRKLVGPVAALDLPVSQRFAVAVRRMQFATTLAGSSPKVKGCGGRTTGLLPFKYLAASVPRAVASALYFESRSLPLAVLIRTRI